MDRVSPLSRIVPKNKLNADPDTREEGFDAFPRVGTRVTFPSAMDYAVACSRSTDHSLFVASAAGVERSERTPSVASRIGTRRNRTSSSTLRLSVCTWRRTPSLPHRRDRKVDASRRKRAVGLGTRASRSKGIQFVSCLSFAPGVPASKPPRGRESERSFETTRKETKERHRGRTFHLRHQTLRLSLEAFDPFEDGTRRSHVLGRAVPTDPPHEAKGPMVPDLGKISISLLRRSRSVPELEPEAKRSS